MHGKGAALDYANENGKTPLMIAIAFQRHNLIAYLIENGADLKARSGPQHAQCPMPNAHAQSVARHAWEDAHDLRTALQALDGQGMSMLHIACWFGHLERARRSAQAEGSPRYPHRDPRQRPEDAPARQLVQNALLAAPQLLPNPGLLGLTL
eukprot:scaffold51845_cov45-Phaeocystis_antarctica.AAC.1